MKAGSVASFDGSMNVGVCHGPPKAPPIITSWRLPNNGEALGETFLDLASRLRALVRDSRGFGVVPIRTFVFEKPLLNVRTPNLRMMRKLYGIAGIIEMVAYELDVDCFEMDAGTWKKTFCGRGNVSKKEKPYPPMVRCDDLGWKVNDYDQADACGIWATFLAMHDHDMFPTELFQER